MKLRAQDSGARRTKKQLLDELAVLRARVAQLEMANGTHREVEEELRRSEASLAEAQRVAHPGNWDWNIEANELWWSDEIHRIFGPTPRLLGGEVGS